ncbi:hypothetical protein LZ30DRAFT_625268 [Colletotrichum cereale]|nr:hypothetical protein LZ30DRAFT_625268 [Colletotrichum cereale]
MASSGLFYSPTAAMQCDLRSTIINGSRLVNGLQVPAPLSNCQHNQQHDAQQSGLANYTGLFHSPTAELLRGRTATEYRLVNGYRVPKKTSRLDTMSLPFKEESNLFHSLTAALVCEGEASARRIGNLQVPPRLSGNQHQSAEGRDRPPSLAIHEPQSQYQNWLFVNEPIVDSPTAAFLRGPGSDSRLQTHNGLRIPEFISRRRKTTGSITSNCGVEIRVRNTGAEASCIFQKHSLNATSRAIDDRTHHSYQTARAAHVLHLDPNNVEGDDYRTEAKQVQLCTYIDLAVSHLHDPFTNEDRQVLRQILGYLDQHGHELVAHCISVDSNAPQVNVPASWLEVADLAFEGIRTVDYPYLLRVMQAIDILSCGIWYADSEQEDKEGMNKENAPLEPI